MNGEKLLDKDNNNMDSLQRCDYLNLNPRLIVRHFQHRVETFFKVIVVNDPLDKVKNYVKRVEFKVHESPHIHSHLWINNAPV